VVTAARLLRFDFDIRRSSTVDRVTTVNANETMQAVRARAFGAPDVLAAETTVSPRPASGEVLIEVLAVPVLHLDVQIRSGWERDLFGIEAPYIPGSGYVGRVIELGPDLGDWCEAAGFGGAGFRGLPAEGPRGRSGGCLR